MYSAHQGPRRLQRHLGSDELRVNTADRDVTGVDGEDSREEEVRARNTDTDTPLLVMSGYHIS